MAAYGFPESRPIRRAFPAPGSGFSGVLPRPRPPIGGRQVTIQDPPPPTDFPGGPGGPGGNDRPPVVLPPLPDEPTVGDPSNEGGYGTWYRPGQSYNPYPDYPDFTDRTVYEPEGIERLPQGYNVLQFNSLLPAHRQKMLEQIRSGQYGGMPGTERISRMQEVLNQVRAMGGINYGTPGAGRTRVTRTGGGSNPAAEALRQRRGRQGRSEIRRRG